MMGEMRKRARHLVQYFCQCRINKMRSKKMNPACLDLTFIGNMLSTKLLEGSALQELIEPCSCIIY